jgi:hypothetical protein
MKKSQALTPVFRSDAMFRPATAQKPKTPNRKVRPTSKYTVSGAETRASVRQGGDVKSVTIPSH